MSELEIFLEQENPSEITFLVPGGNHGDTLIYKGAEKVATDLGISFNSIRPQTEQDYRRRLRYLGNRAFSRVNWIPFNEFNIKSNFVFIHGGGNFNDIGGRGISIHYLQYLNNKLQDTTIVVGPQSYWFGSLDLSTILRNSSNDIILFCREVYSYNLLKNFDLPANTEIMLSKDTALYLDRTDLKSYIGSHEDVGTLMAFRNDRESVIDPELKESLKEGDQSPLEADLSNHDKYNFEEFISVSDSSDRIYTDRLHMSILGSLLGKKVTLFPNRYYKNRAVYMHSLEEYENTSFQDII